MKQIIGYLVKDENGEVIGATGNEREAMFIAREYNGVVYKVVTTVNPLDNPKTERTVVYDCRRK